MAFFTAAPAQSPAAISFARSSSRFSASSTPATIATRRRGAPGVRLTVDVRFLGVDLAWSEREPCNETGVVALEPAGRIVAAGWCRGVAEVVDWMTAWAQPD